MQDTICDDVITIEEIVQHSFRTLKPEKVYPVFGRGEWRHLCVSCIYTRYKDDNGKPVRNAAVVLHPVGGNGKQSKGGFELKTDSEGKTEYSGVPYGKLRIQVIAPHPLATITLKNCHVPADGVIGKPGDGLKIALATLDVFRPTVGAAALGFASDWTSCSRSSVRLVCLFQASLSIHFAPCWRAARCTR